MTNVYKSFGCSHHAQGKCSLFSRFLPDKRSGWTLPPETDPGHKSAQLGMKLTCGFEMLAEQATKRNAGCQASASSDPKFQHFVKKLFESGYFRGELEGSKQHQLLLEQARQFYAETDNDSQFNSSVILDLLQKYRLGALDVDNDSSLASSDDESWLDVEPESFDDLLRQHFKLDAEMSGATSSKSESELPAEIKRFLQSLSDFDGIQVCLPVGSMQLLCRGAETKYFLNYVTLGRQILSLDATSLDLSKPELATIFVVKRPQNCT